MSATPYSRHATKFRLALFGTNTRDNSTLTIAPEDVEAIVETWRNGHEVTLIQTRSGASYAAMRDRSFVESFKEGR